LPEIAELVPRKRGISLLAQTKSVTNALNRERSFKFSVGDVKVDYEDSLEFSFFHEIHETPKKPIEEKGEKEKGLFLMDASLAPPRATGLEMDCHCEERDSSLTVRNGLRTLTGVGED
jgi:hypothetical protein